MTSKSTRGSTKLRIIDKFAAKIKNNVLPTYEDVLRYYAWIRLEMKKSSNQEPSAKCITSEVGQRVIEVWKKASIPTVTEARVSQLVLSYCGKYRQILKNYNREPKSKSFEEKIHNFISQSTLLFDIAACKCKKFDSCKCGKVKAVPFKERSFLEDQRTLRQMVIGNIDITTTKQLQKKVLRAQKRQKTSEPQPSTSGTALITLSDSDVQSTDSSEDEVFVERKTKKRKTSHQNLEKLSDVCDRYGISYRAGAAIASAALSDVLKEEKSAPIIIDHSKLRRERVKRRTTLLKTQRKEPIEALFFDGRKDQTMYYVRTNNKIYRRVRVEEHITMIQEPGAVYIGHVTPSAGTSKCIVEAMICHLTEKKHSLDFLNAVGCDGTNVNTGRKSGVIVLLEKHLQRPLQWLICQLHANELPLRHLFQHFDGQTTGPTSFSGPIGKALKTCENRPITKFEPIFVSLPHIPSNKLSTDQKYLYDICLAVASGEVSPDLAKRNPGKMSHARWLTTANRILRLYVSTEKPSSKLRLLATYICKAYSPTWFQIKCNSSCKDGARNLWFLIKNTRFLSEDIKKIIDPVIERNAYFAHTENLLLAMLTDDNEQIRELGCRRVIKARTSPQALMRNFVIPKINFECHHYYDLINWNDEKLILSEPPLLRHTETAILEKNIRRGNVMMFEFPKFPCHTQAVERCVKLTTEAAGSIAGVEAREGFIACKLNSRKIMPKFNSKEDFK